MSFILNPDFTANKDAIKDFIINFNSKGILFGDGKRNKIKVFELDTKSVNIKSFKVPNLINQVVYKFFRKSKAKRSFEYATRLMQMGIGTPTPIAYSENFSLVGLQDSYYVCQHLLTELTFRELVEIPDYPENELILRQFVNFSFQLHDKGVEFLDHSPGNTLIKKIDENNYEFYLVDLNRMKFHTSKMSISDRMKNICRITPGIAFVEIISKEYARIANLPEQEVFDLLYKHSSEFFKKFDNKKKLKKYLKFK